MAEIRVHPATRREARWAAGREFVHLPPVDPAFAPENMGAIRRLLLRYLALPANYRKLVGRYLEVDGSPAGYIFARPGQLSMRIDSLAVEPEYRRQGCASQLLNEITQAAKGRGLETLGTTINPENEAGLAFFRHHGFRAYQPEQWVLKEVNQLETEGKGYSIRELSPTQLVEAYNRWMDHEVKQGDAWVEDVILNEYPRLALVARARHWACLLDGEEVGYLRLDGLRGAFKGYLAADESTWAGAGQLSWLAQAVKEYPLPPTQLTLALGSWGHHKAAQLALEEAGFERRSKPRFLLFKALEKPDNS